MFLNKTQTHLSAHSEVPVSTVCFLRSWHEIEEVNLQTTRLYVWRPHWSQTCVSPSQVSNSTSGPGAHIAASSTTSRTGRKKPTVLHLCGHKTSRACSHRGRNDFSPYKNCSCLITQLLSRPKVLKSHCVISQEPFVYSVSTMSALTPPSVGKRRNGQPCHGWCDQAVVCSFHGRFPPP